MANRKWPQGLYPLLRAYCTGRLGESFAQLPDQPKGQPTLYEDAEEDLKWLCGDQADPTGAARFLGSLGGQHIMHRMNAKTVKYEPIPAESAAMHICVNQE